jgi:uracil-DNA glycosylase
MTPFPSSSWRPSTRNYFGQRKKFEPTSPDAHACMRARTLHVPVSLIRSRPLLSSPAIMTKERSITSFFKPVNARPRDGDDAKAEIVPLKKLKENMPMLEVQDGDEVKTAEKCGGAYADLLKDEQWRKILSSEFKKPYWERLEKFLESEDKARAKVFPPKEHVFRAFDSCSMEEVKVVIIGQDPYHDDGQAMGLCFSVPKGVKVPSSLHNIYKELHADLNCKVPTHGDLSQWAKQGVFLLNASLTVRAHAANSHSKKGWENFTDAAIREIAKNRRGLVFLLWGKNAQEKEKLISKANDHLILKCPHPSGLSAHRGFFGSRHFSQCNKFIEANGGTPIDWQIDGPYRSVAPKK